MKRQPRNTNRPAIYAGKAHAEKYDYDIETSYVWKKPQNRNTNHINKKDSNLFRLSL